jgi:4-hydroxy-4-methyl-2-oxoglutarate aldolase
MTGNQQVPASILGFLRRTDTCTVSNAIETFQLRMCNEGFVQGSIRCLFPALPPVAGYAVTGTIRSTAPPISGHCYYQRPDWWHYVAASPGPKIMVIQDLDHVPGTGALFGEIHAEIGRALGCVGYLTNGIVRDLGPLASLGVQCFARGAGVSHSYSHIVEFGIPVHIGALQIAPGDLLHGDINGIHSIPFSIADQLPARVGEITARESELIALCRAPEFSADKLEDALRVHANWDANRGPRP